MIANRHAESLDLPVPGGGNAPVLTVSEIEEMIGKRAGAPPESEPASDAVAASIDNPV